MWLQYTPWRVSCSRCGVKVERVPWADGSSVFTATFEESAAYLAQVTVERVVARRLDGARFDALKRIGVAEFSYRPICRTACRRSPAKTARNVRRAHRTQERYRGRVRGGRPTAAGHRIREAVRAAGRSANMPPDPDSRPVLQRWTAQVRAHYYGEACG